MKLKSICPYCGCVNYTMVNVSAYKNKNIIECYSEKENSCSQDYVLEYHFEPQVEVRSINGYETKTQNKLKKAMGYDECPF